MEINSKININPRLQYCIFNNCWIHDSSIPTQYPNITLDDFNYIDLGKIADFDDVESQFDLLKDTALAYTRDILCNLIIHNIKDKKNQRTLLYFLLSEFPHKDVKDYMINFAKMDPIILKYCVIKLTQKEMELKIEGRMFGQSPYIERARRCILDHNVSKLMSKYNKL